MSSIVRSIDPGVYQTILVIKGFNIANISLINDNIYNYGNCYSNQSGNLTITIYTNYLNYSYSITGYCILLYTKLLESNRQFLLT